MLRLRPERTRTGITLHCILREFRHTEILNPKFRQIHSFADLTLQISVLLYEYALYHSQINLDFQGIDFSQRCSVAFSHICTS